MSPISNWFLIIELYFPSQNTTLIFHSTNLFQWSKVTSKSHFLSAKWWRKCMNICKSMSWSIWNFLISNLAPFNSGAWKCPSSGPKEAYWKSTKMFVETILVHHSKIPFMQFITYNVSLISRGALERLPSYHLSSSIFIFPIFPEPYHAQIW